MANFVFISPTFPKTYYQFPQEWKKLGGNALCIGEDSWESLSEEMKRSMTEYYRVNSMQNYDEMYKAVAWFAHKYGKIDWLESNNEFWLEQDARLRTDFNITSGDKTADVMRFKLKSNMKAYYHEANVPVARYHLTSTYEEGKKFVDEVGYPVIVKPDNGVGACATWKIKDEEGLKDFYKQDLPTQYIMEEFVPGSIVSFDGITDQDGNIIFKTSHGYSEPIMDVVNGVEEIYYWSDRKIPEDLDTIGTRVIKAFNIHGRFFHTEYFRLTEDKKGLGKKGDIVGLEVNMRPPGGYTPDMMNFANDISVYNIYAQMAMNNHAEYHSERPYHVVFVGKRDQLKYKNSAVAIAEHYTSAIRMHERMPDILATAMGNDAYIARFKTMEEAKEFVDFVLEKASEEKK